MITFSNVRVPMLPHVFHGVSSDREPIYNHDVEELPNGHLHKHKFHPGVPILHQSKHVQGWEEPF
ncbi:MAG TPA: hypothetical protein VK543_17740 [Puia sp.]|nr:hypothetical protein [Puia sp.]